MRSAYLLALCAHASLSLAAALPEPNSAAIPSRIWLTTPGVNWNDSFLVGNGRLGAAIGGAVSSDTIYMNEDSLWSGGPLDRINPSAGSQVPIMQEDVRNNESAAATEIGGYAYVGTPVSTRNYDPLTMFGLSMDAGGGSTSKYERWLDLADATSGVYYTTTNGVTYEREFLASEPGGVIAMRIRSDTPGAVSFHIHLDRSEFDSLSVFNRWEDYTYALGSDTTIMGGASGGRNAIGFTTGAKIVSTDGAVSTLGDYVFCKNATEAYIYFAAWTTFRKNDTEAAVLADLNAAGNSTYAEVRAAHVADYQELYNRTALDIGTSTSEQKAANTSSRLTAMSSGAFDPEVAVLYFQFGRYLLIASSRAGTLPPNLQGIWNTNFNPGWGSKYTININLEMNYWPAYVTNLAETTSPLYDFIDRLRINGTIAAKQMYNASGACAHHNTDMWADPAPQDNYLSSTYWPSGLGWLSTHIMEHYMFTGNATFLREQYEVLHDVVEFYLTFVTDGPNGWKVTNPSLSPENQFYPVNGSTATAAVTMGPTFDNSLIWDLVGYTLEAMSVIDEDDEEFARSITKLRSQLPPIRVSYFGGVQEWIYDYNETDPGHRHFSPLFGLYPGDQITSANATTFDAAKNTLIRRLSNAGGSTGWSRAWAISLAARGFLNYEVHDSFLTQLVSYTYPTSLLDTGPPAPFQMDGNSGAPAGVAEALLQSHELVAASNSSSNAPYTTGNSSATTASNGSALEPTYWGYPGSKTTLIRLLPALPMQWAENGGGSFRGLRARGGFEVDVAWDENAVLTGANITSLLGNSAWVTVGSAPIGTEAAKTNLTGGPISIDGAGSGRFVLLSTQKGKAYSVTAA